MAKKDCDNILVALHKKAEDATDSKPPMSPYTEKDVLKKAPPKFEYEKYTLMPPEDARRINQTLAALMSRAEQIEDLDASYKEMRVNITNKIQELQQEQGYDKIKQEMTGLRDKIVGDVENTLETVGDALIENNNLVMTIIDKVKKGSVTNTDTQQAMSDAIKKYASPEIAGKIIDEAQTVIDQMIKAKEVVTRRLVSWPSPQDLRKKVLQEQTTGSKIAGVMDVIQSVVDVLRGLWTSVKDSLSGLLSSVEQAQPVVDEMKSLLAQSGEAVVSKKLNKKENTMTKTAIGNVLAGLGEKQADFIDRNEAGVRNDYADKLIELMGAEWVLDELVGTLSDSVAVDNLKYVARMQDLGDVLEGIEDDAGMRHSYADALKEVMGEYALLDNFVRALSDDEAISAFDYIVQVGDLQGDLEAMYGNSEAVVEEE